MSKKGPAPARSPSVRGSDEFADLAAMFDIALRARGRAAKTRSGYQWAIGLLRDYLQSRAMPLDPGALAREHVEEFIADLRDRPARGGGLWSSASVAGVYRSLHAWFAWMVETGEIARSPMEKMRPPAVRREPPPVMSEADIGRLCDVCRGSDFNSRRDLAVIVLLLDTGCRREELAGVAVADVDFENQVIRVLGKGDKVRWVSFGDQAALVLRRYTRARRSHRATASPALWLGNEGPWRGGNAIMMMVRRRAKQAGIERRVWVHLFRHTWAHYFLEAGGQERDLKRLGGWDSDEMVRWYGSSQEDRRAQKAHREFSPADRLLGRAGDKKPQGGR